MLKKVKQKLTESFEFFLPEVLYFFAFLVPLALVNLPNWHPLTTGIINNESNKLFFGKSFLRSTK